jgi:hypothetical protein
MSFGSVRVKSSMRPQTNSLHLLDNQLHRQTLDRYGTLPATGAQGSAEQA